MTEALDQMSNQREVEIVLRISKSNNLILYLKDYKSLNSFKGKENDLKDNYPKICFRLP